MLSVNVFPAEPASDLSQKCYFNALGSFAPEQSSQTFLLQEKRYFSV